MFLLVETKYNTLKFCKIRSFTSAIWKKPLLCTWPGWQKVLLKCSSLVYCLPIQLRKTVQEKTTIPSNIKPTMDTQL